MTAMTLDAVARENARSAPAAIAAVCGSHRVEYGEMQGRVERLATVLTEAGVVRGDRVVWLAQNCHRWLEALVASARIGAIFCSLNWRQTVDELRPVITELDPKIVLWQRADGMDEVAAGVRPFIGQRATMIAIDDESREGYEARLADAIGIADDSVVPESEVLADDPVLMLYTANPDGGSNGSMLSHTNLLTAAGVMAQLQTIDAGTVNLASAPLFHIASLFALVPTFVMRGTNVFVSRAGAAPVCEAIHEHRCTRGFLLGPTAEEIVTINETGRYDLSSFASSLPFAGWRAMVRDDTSPWGMHPGGYGQTETGMVVLSALGEPCSTMTSGRVAPYAEVRLVDPDDRDVEAGAVGEIVARGATVHCGYFNRFELNRHRFRGGWWHTNDLGRRDPDGTVVFVGPVGRLLKSGAENIYAAEVESCLESHPAVKEAAVIGVPDPVWVQSIKAIVVVEAGQSVTEAELLQHCRARLASYKKPRTVEFLPMRLPRIGPIKDYGNLDAQFGGGNYPGEGTRSV